LSSCLQTLIHALTRRLPQTLLSFSTCLGVALKWLCNRSVGRVVSSCALHTLANAEDMIPQKAGIYHTTSVDAAKSNHTTLSLAGQKRTYGGFRDKESQRDAPVLVNIINTAGFQRPTVYEENNLATIEPGKVQDVAARDQSIYSQRRSLALTPTVASNPLLDLSHPAYGLPKQLVDNFASVGIKSIYPWQSECLLKSGALREERNLVYTAPTGGGKSLVADVLMLKHVIDIPGKKAILVLPYVALVQEKMRWLRKVVEGILKTTASSSLGEHRTSGWRKRGDEDTVRVVGFFGGSKSKATWDDTDIAVCTIEKVGEMENIKISADD
jgi:hypothetical protein